MDATEPRWKGPRLRRKLIESGIAVAILVLLGVFAFPFLLKAIVERQASEHLGRRVEVGRLRLDPFSGTIDVKGLEVFEPDARTSFVSLARLYVNVESWASLFRAAPVVKELRLESPRVRLVRLAKPHASGPFNFSDIVARHEKQPKETPNEPEKPPQFSLNNIQILDGAITLDDQVKRDQHSISEIDLRLPFVSTLAVHVDRYIQPGLRARIDGAPIELTGSSRPFKDTRESTLELRLDRFDLRRLVPVLPVVLPFQVASAYLDARLSLAFRSPAGEPPRLLVRGRTALLDVKLRDRGAPLFGLKRFAVMVGAADVLKRRVTLNEVDIRGIDVYALRGDDGTLALGRFAARRTPSKADAHAPPPREKPPPALQVELRALTLADAALHVRDEEDPLQLAALDLRGVTLDSGKRTADAATLGLKGAKARVRRTETGLIDLATLGGGPAPAEQEPKPEPATPPEDSPSRTPNPWRVSLGTLTLAGGGVALEDRTTEPPAVLQAEPITLEARDLSNAPKARSKFTLNVGLPGEGRVMVTGTAALAPLDADLRFDVRALDLLPLQPYFGAQLALVVTAGSVSARGRLGVTAASFPTGAPAPPRLTLAGDVEVSDFASIDKTNREPLLKLRTLSLGGLSFANAPTTLTAKQIALRDFFARLSVSPKGQFNLAEVLQPRPPPPAAAPAQKAPPPPRPADKAPPPRIRIGAIALSGGRIQFIDRSIRPTYATEFSQIGGRLSGLSSDRRTQADVNVKGRVDRTGSFAIRGKVNPLAQDLFVDLAIDVQDVELPPVSPYSSKFAGYPIERGKLALSLGYVVKGRRLKARNHLTLDQFTFGEKVESESATNLPVRLAVTLLTDRHGVIDVDLPIEGSLDDPNFKLFRAVLKALGTLIAKAATAPFALIGSAFGGGDELGQVEFAPGSASLDEKARAKITTLGKALRDRPGLALEVAGAADVKNDRDGLRRRWLEQKLRAQKTIELAKSGVAVSDPEAVQVEPGERARLLEKAYDAERFSKPRNFIGMSKRLPPEEMEKLMLANAAADDEALRTLAQSRAGAVRDAIVKVEPAAAGRLFVVAPRVATSAGADAHQVDLRLRGD